MTMRCFIRLVMFCILLAPSVLFSDTTPAHPRLFLDAASVPALRAQSATPACAAILDSIRRIRSEGDPFGPTLFKTFGN